MADEFTYIALKEELSAGAGEFMMSKLRTFMESYRPKKQMPIIYCR